MYRHWHGLLYIYLLLTSTRCIGTGMVYYIYIYYWTLQWLQNVIINKTKVLLPHTYGTLVNNKTKVLLPHTYATLVNNKTKVLLPHTYGTLVNNKTKVLLPHTYGTLVDLCYPVQALWRFCSRPKSFKIFCFPLYWLIAYMYLMKVIPETRRAH